MPDHILGLKLMRAPRDFRTLCFGLRHFLAAAFYYAASICLLASASLFHRMGEGRGEGSPNQSIPWAQLGVNATAQYSGDGLGVIATPLGAQLRCVLQKLEGEVTVDGLSLSSTVPETRDQLRVTATRLGRDGGQNLVLDKNGAASYLFDGQVKAANWLGSPNDLLAGQVIWGTGSGTGQGRMNFHSATFAVTNSIVASYDAGTHGNPPSGAESGDAGLDRDHRSGNIGWRRSASGARRLDSSVRMVSMKLQHVIL